ncbi:MAG: VWA-like domain-containing protein, partial [Promethearchaeota archaeon]
TIKENISVVIGIDTSGSIGQEELTEFLSEVVGIARTYNNIKMRLLTHDYEIQDDYEVRNGNIKKIMNLKIHGDGGTSHKCVYDYIKQKKIDCRVLVLFTDGYSDLEEIKSDIKTIIVLCKNAKDIKREDVKDLNVEKIIKM